MAISLVCCLTTIHFFTSPDSLIAFAPRIGEEGEKKHEEKKNEHNKFCDEPQPTTPYVAILNNIKTKGK